MNILDEVLRKYEESLELSQDEVTDVNQKGSDDDTPLHKACFRGDLEDVEVLIAYGAEINALGDMGETPLHNAVAHENIEVVKLLLEMVS